MEQTVQQLFGIPQWFHHRGYKMNVENIDFEKKALELNSSAAQVTITRIDQGWLVSWEVRHSQLESANGTVFFSTANLRDAFFLISGHPDRFDDWLIKQYDADAAMQRKFIRHGYFLNIPCPGTGHDGDPNVSIFIDHEIQDAVQTLIQGFE